MQYPGKGDEAVTEDLAIKSNFCRRGDLLYGFLLPLIHLIFITKTVYDIFHDPLYKYLISDEINPKIIILFQFLYPTEEKKLKIKKTLHYYPSTRKQLSNFHQNIRTVFNILSLYALQKDLKTIALFYSLR